MIYFGHVIHKCWYLHFLKIYRDFFRIFRAFYVAFCAYRPIPIRVAETDPSQCPPSQRPRPRLWTMIRIRLRNEKKFIITPDQRVSFLSSSYALYRGSNSLERSSPPKNQWLRIRSLAPIKVDTKPITPGGRAPSRWLMHHDGLITM